MGMFFHDRGEAPPERPTDPEVRRANLRRIGQLFRPYWRRLSGLLGLIVVSAGLGVLPAFLLRRVLVAIQAHDTRGVSLNAAAMIVIAIVAGILGVIQTLLTRRVGNERRRIAKTTQESLADISSIVQESLSVSGILLGKTMGRGDELADRFEGESLRLADLEVRQRMAGRWVMASIQTSFAIMPAAVYWFGGLALAHGSTAISIPVLVAFTTLQTRLFFPIGSLLGVGLDAQTSLALFDRIFEYLDQPIDIEAKPDALAVGQPGDVVFDHVWFRYGKDW